MIVMVVCSSRIFLVALSSGQVVGFVDSSGLFLDLSVESDFREPFSYRERFKIHCRAVVDASVGLRNFIGVERRCEVGSTFLVRVRSGRLG